MKSKNKRPPNALERAWVGMLAEQDCVVCGAWGVQIHEFEQGHWFSSVPICPACHVGPEGWHGTRQRWKLRHMTPTRAIAKAVEQNFRQLRGAVNA